MEVTMEFTTFKSGHLGYPELDNYKEGSLPPLEIQERQAEKQLNNLNENEKSELESLEEADQKQLLPMPARERLHVLREKAQQKSEETQSTKSKNNSGSSSGGSVLPNPLV